MTTETEKQDRCTPTVTGPGPRQQEFLEVLPQPSYRAWGASVGATAARAKGVKAKLNSYTGIQIEERDGQLVNVA